MPFSRFTGRRLLSGLLLTMTLPASAMLIDRGPVTYDRESGLEWLDLSQGYGLSLTEVDRHLGAEGQLSGFRWTGREDITGLITNNWRSPDALNDTHVHPSGLTGISTVFFFTSEEQMGLFSLLGATPFAGNPAGGSCQGYVLSGRLAPQAGSEIGGRARTSLPSCSDASGQVRIDGETAIYGIELKQPDLYVAEERTGSWIVRHVPEPLTWSLLLAGLLGCILRRGGPGSEGQ